MKMNIITHVANLALVIGAALVVNASSVFAAPWERNPIPNDPCSTHEPLETNSLGCIFGPEGDALKVGPCAMDGSAHPLGERLRHGKEAVEAALQHIRDSFGLDGGEEVDQCVDSTKVGFHEGAMKNRLRRAVLSPPNSKWRNLTFVAAGSSVTAGHDNLYDQAYPFAFERATSCALKSAGINLLARDAALGANQALQYSMCNQKVVGADVDLVMWEVNNMMGSDGGLEWELAMRNFFNPDMFPNRPSLVYPSTGVSSRPIWGEVGKGCSMGGPRKRECNNHADIIATNLCPDPECTYIPLPDGPAKMEGKVKPDSNFAQLATLYADYGTGEFSPLQCIAQHSDKWKFSGSYMLRVGKRLNQAKGWHFGPYGHKFFGEAFAFIYLRMFKEVLEEIDSARPEGVHGADLMMWGQGYMAGLGMPSKTLPEPKWGSRYPPLYTPNVQCATTMEPHQHLVYTDHEGKPIEPRDMPEAEVDGSGGVLVRPGSDDLLGWAVLLDQTSAPVMDMRDYCTEFSHCPVPLQKRAENSQFFNKNQVKSVADSGKWVVSIVENGLSRGEVALGFTNNWGWKDRKYVLQGNLHSGTLKLRLHMKQATKGLAVCSAPFCNKKSSPCTADGRVWIGDGLAIAVDDRDVTSHVHKKGDKVSHEMKAFEDKMCLWVNVDLAPGPHVLGLSGTNALMVNIGHIFWW